MVKSKLELSVIFPVYNERHTIETVIREWRKELRRLRINFQIIICEDGSSDGTSQFLKKISSKYKLLLNQKKTRRGYGQAVIDGIKLATSEYILSVDSDGQCDPKDLSKFWQRRLEAEVLIGWRKNRADALQRKIFSQLFKLVCIILFKPPVHDPSAPFVLYRRSIIKPNLKYLKYLSEGFWWGFVGMCTKKGLKLSEEPINHRSRFNGQTVVFKLKKIPSIALRNIIGLFRLKFA
ncbi:hypothetical protein A2209_04030 [Candidatus Roizmanbacteria bacterium RIFOXYA1_FULL_41_12]|uniref:Glycosyltransferase 2-like domain-containing protein n=1 Tax=Candidatus Roizmanbacteria bacterium RIFOXYA1_FULL_41_12 TaxID=1802082 RepID=A0A1F7KAD7_9BACT|nr:MAG: hypothetical protein A2209_04030 [Candidatus Roizmanbacteria bacterium RIFOXYA1_FULL_41_12]OGK66223.1 MAG: hypothetical protein A2262_02240 [Candidatus Roizmanbacteria bacterium RIFOXYA2_FULL_41_8]OGK66897.1 MAG: hypothetical protein A2377_03295 [Candidatus Roizmanbacteria bacterium RIFOXYB1_FULL_41_27]OGK70729.1 MAG: hypothetical protein A2403_01410 [Candidatus Roizmanbacteria bacterium RIFOXYC1_FULL_41_16]OGK75691.1 MAG: hypothetical protein A2575_03285 [Candidatus Roizmanbacteria bac